MRVIRAILLSLAGLVLLVAGLLGWFVYSPRAELPQLSGTLSRGSLEVGDLKRTYLLYTPKGLPKGAPLVMALHGSDQDGAEMRTWTGYGFERLADEKGFAVAYPDGYGGNWNGCNVVGDYSANKLDIDDVKFLDALADKLVTELGVDQKRVFATGVSRGGHMAYRLALEAPEHFRAVAAVSANVPVPENFKCHPAAEGSASVMMVEGTADPLNPFEGGEVSLFGAYKRGKVRSARESGQYLADLDRIPGTPETTESDAAGSHIQDLLWGKGGHTEVEFVAIQGAGHGMPQPYWRYPRILGPTSKLDGPAMIWGFFARQH